MDLRQLEMFIAVAKHGSITKASEALRVSQPSVTAQIHSMEAKIGSPLFIRLPRGVRTTEIGDIILKNAKKILSQVEDIYNQIDEVIGLQKGELTIGVIPSMINLLCSKVIYEFNRLYPGITLKILEGRSKELFDYLLDDKIDFALVTSFISHPSINITTIFNDRLVVISAFEDEHSAKAEVDLIDLADSTFIFPSDIDQLYGYRNIIYQACKEAGFEPKINMYIESTQGIIAAVKSKIGISIVPYSLVYEDEEAGSLKVTSLRYPNLQRAIQSITRKDDYIKQSTKRFISMFEELINPGKIYTAIPKQ